MLRRLLNALRSTFSINAMKQAMKNATVTAEPLLLRNRAERRAGHRLN